METTNIEIWNRHYLKPESKQSYPDEALVRMVRSLPDSSPGSKDGRNCLDFGCGSGRHISLFMESGYTVTGCDSSSNAIAHCRELYPDARFLISNDLSVPLARTPDGLYDLIVCWGVIHYLSQEEARVILENLKRWIRPGGFLLGTLRKDTDTQFQSSAVSQSSIHVYDESALQQLLGEAFAQYEYGFMERSLLGKLESIVAHWFFRARKDTTQ